MEPRPLRTHTHSSELAPTIRTTLRLAVNRGTTEAHITVEPRELGTVQIRLRYHDGGVTADIAATSTPAAELLESHGEELRRSLEQQGVTVHGLDVQLASSDTPPRQNREGFAEPSAHREHTPDEEPLPDPIDLPVAHLDGAQVDVLA